MKSTQARNSLKRSLPAVAATFALFTGAFDFWPYSHLLAVRPINLQDWSYSSQRLAAQRCTGVPILWRQKMQANVIGFTRLAAMA